MCYLEYNDLKYNRCRLIDFSKKENGKIIKGKYIIKYYYEDMLVLIELFSSDDSLIYSKTFPQRRKYNEIN